MITITKINDNNVIDQNNDNSKFSNNNVDTNNNDHEGNIKRVFLAP